MNWTEQQDLVVKKIAGAEEDLATHSVAGSGKTSVLVAGVNGTSTHKDVLCCAFNKSIANELAQRMPPNADCKTMHSMGYRAWAQHIKLRRLDMQPRKPYRVADSIDKKLTKFFPGIVKLQAVAKSFGIVPDSVGQHDLGVNQDTD